MAKSSVSIAIAGYGGTGVITTGTLLLTTAARQGWYGIAQRSFGPQIRGGESLSLLRLGIQQQQNLDDKFNCLVLLDTQHVDRFAAEVPLDKNSVVIIPDSNAKVPGFITESAARVVQFDINEKLEVNPDKDMEAGGENIIAAGFLAQLLGLDAETIKTVTAEKFQHNPELAGKASLWLQAGVTLANTTDVPLDIKLEQPTEKDSKTWLINGNEAAGFGALNAGIRFVAAYPITPASSALEWLAPNLEKAGGNLVQAEDELASINMIIGSSFGGVPSMTATSGPGLALMSESLGLAVASETPLVILNVMRGGPSTGIPTKSEQSDLNIALHGLHGDAPHIVTAALSVADCAFTAGWSVDLAERLQTPVIMLSDQAMAQTDACIKAPELWPGKASRLVAKAEADTPYHRYALTESGISPMAVPGEEGLEYTGDGLEHNEHGTPSAAAEHHYQQLEKRAAKLLNHDYGDNWCEKENSDSKTLLLCWGSLYSASSEACSRLRQQGTDCGLIALRLLAPLQKQALEAAFQQCERILVVEQSHGGQFIGWLRSQLDFSCPVHSLALPGPLPVRPADIVNAVNNWGSATKEIKHAANC